MARKKAGAAPAQEAPVVENLVEIDVAEEMENSFLEYAYSVIYSRALPDARDGLKPVQRRILYMMADMGLAPEKGHVKSARVVGEVMGKLHPHGDSAIYDALVRMAQAFSLRLPLVDGHGNFGSLDDGPAASRYTEARLAPAALLMTAGLEEDVVDFVPNYDNRLQQPEVLPAAYPNLLVNGASGIAVGMATNMPPHNLGEVIAAARHLLKDPAATVESLMRLVPGPDLPSGGTITGLAEIRKAYLGGRGTFRTRATVEVRKLTARKTGLVVTELPYQVGPEKVIEKVKEAVNQKKLQGVSDVVDLTDRNGLQLVIEVKNGFNPQAVLEQLYRHTPMEDSFGINNVALVGGQPRLLGLKELLEVYVGHRLQVVRRRTLHRYGRKSDRLHLVEGLILAMVDIDRVIEIVRSSEEAAAAREALQEGFGLSEPQANHILDLRLRQLTKFSRLELEKEADELRRQIGELSGILESDDLLRRTVSQELAEVSKRFATPRRTVLIDDEGSALAGSGASGSPALPVLPARKGSRGAALELEMADVPCRVALSSTGLLVRVDEDPGSGAPDAFRTPWGTADNRATHDVMASLVRTTTRSSLGLVTNLGRMHRIEAVDVMSLPEMNGPLRAVGALPAAEYLVDPLEGERPVALVDLPPADAAVQDSAGHPMWTLAVGTRAGVVKRVVPAWPSASVFEVIGLKEDDEVLGCQVVRSEQDMLCFITDQAQLLRFPAESVRPQGRAGSGVAGIRLPDGARAILFTVVPGDAQAVVATVTAGDGTIPGLDSGSYKLSAFADFPVKGRATQGVRCHRLLKGEQGLLRAWVGTVPAGGNDAAGQPVSLEVLEGHPAKRDGSGVPLTERPAALGGIYQLVDAGL